MRIFIYSALVVILAGFGFYFMNKDIQEELKHPEVTLFNATTIPGCDHAYQEAITFCSTGDTNTFCVEERLKELAACTAKIKNSDICKPYVAAREACKAMADKDAANICKTQARTNPAWQTCHR